MKKNARAIAYEIIDAVKYEKAYSNVTINKVFQKYSVDAQDRGFITELVYGVLSRLLYLDAVIAQYSSMKVKKQSRRVSTVLQMGVYQLMFMDGVKSFAAVDESVKLIKALDFRSRGFVNALLRAISRDLEAKNKKEILDMSWIQDQKKYYSIRYSVSEYIAGRFLKLYGEDFTQKLLESMYERPGLFIRLNRLKEEVDHLIENLASEGVYLDPVKGRNDVFLVNGLKRIGQNHYFKEGYFSIQDLSSMQAVDILDPKPGEYVLDICSAPGGKSFYMAEKMNNQGRIDACDISEHKLKLLLERSEELGIGIIHPEVLDARIFQQGKKEIYDKVLVDAPCSGFGILRRKPEIRYKEYEDVKELPQIQTTILDHASRYLKTGGILMYSTCTLEKKENMDQVEKFLSSHKDFVLESRPRELYPHLDGSDGFFIAKFRKTTSVKFK